MLAVLVGVGSLLHRRGLLVEAEPCYREVLKLRSQHQGEVGSDG